MKLSSLSLQYIIPTLIGILPSFSRKHLILLECKLHRYPTYNPKTTTNHLNNYRNNLLVAKLQNIHRKFSTLANYSINHIAIIEFQICSHIYIHKH